MMGGFKRCYKLMLTEKIVQFLACIRARDVLERMGNYAISCLITTLVVYLILIGYKQQVSGAPALATNMEQNHRNRNRPFVRLTPHSINHLQFKPDLGDFIVDDDDFFEQNKRQTSDDYGHLRFGKRDEFDDYGHMRFGRSRGIDSHKYK